MTKDKWVLVRTTILSIVLVLSSFIKIIISFMYEKEGLIKTLMISIFIIGEIIISIILLADLLFLFKKDRIKKPLFHIFASLIILYEITLLTIFVWTY